VKKKTKKNDTTKKKGKKLVKPTTNHNGRIFIEMPLLDLATFQTKDGKRCFSILFLGGAG